MCTTEFGDIQFNYSLNKQFCDQKSSKYRIEFRPLSGNTIFWSNVDEEGNGHQMNSHAAHSP